MIVVTGATGKLGRLVVEQLLGRIPAARIGVSVRDPAKAADLAACGVRVRRGDFADPASLPHAFEGADRLLIVSSNAAATGGDPLAQHRAAIDAARAVGVGRVLYTSHMGAGAVSAFPPMRDHAATEAMLRASGLAWTALRNGFYAQSGVMLMGDYAVSGRIDAPADGPVAWTAHADLAEAAALMLTGEEPANGPTPPLTAGEALDLDDLAAIASDVAGRSVTRTVVAPDAFAGTMAVRGVSEPATRIALGLYAASRAREFARVDPTLERLLGRPPVRMRDLIAEAIAPR